jgi:hypothetical protein
VEGKKITDQQTVAETFNNYFVAIAENVKRQRKNNFINDDNNSVDNHTHSMEQQHGNNYTDTFSHCVLTTINSKVL